MARAAGHFPPAVRREKSAIQDAIGAYLCLYAILFFRASPDARLGYVNDLNTSYFLGRTRICTP